MSQKVRILGVKHSGNPVYLGDDSEGNPRWSRNPDKIMDWLCDGWRFRFNQHRQYRTERKPYLDESTGERVWVETPLGGRDVPESLTDSQARSTFSWIASMPSMVIQSATRVENAEWFASLKRIKTTKRGSAPGFRSRHRSDQQFVCWFNGGQNAKMHMVNRRTGVVIIKGQNKAKDSKPGHTSRWKLHIKVRVSQPIRSYTNVSVNWTRGTLVFTSPVADIERYDTGAMVGLDRGVTHTLATSDGVFHDIPAESPRRTARYLQLQRDLARKDRINEAEGGRQAKFNSRRRQRVLDEMRRIKRLEVRRREDWLHKLTTDLVKNHDLIALENLKTRAMTANGGAFKRGLNRGILQNSWSKLLGMLQYKSLASGSEVVLVDPAYTSQTCSKCGHVARENRESQAVFKCIQCGHVENADINAARNILSRAISGQDDGLGRGGSVRPLTGASLDEAVLDEASTPALAHGL